MVSRVTAVPGDHGDLAVLDDQEAAGVVEHRRHVGGQEGLTVAQPHHQGADHPGGHDATRLVAGHGHQCVCPRRPGDGVAHRLLQVAVVDRGHQVRQHLGVGLRPEPDPRVLQLAAQLPVVLDDPVVDHHEVPRSVGVGVGVPIRRNTVSGPAGVADPRPPAQRRLLQAGHQPVELALGLGHGHRAVVGHRHSRRVVTPVLEAAQPPDQDLLRRSGTYVADDSAHAVLLDHPHAGHPHSAHRSGGWDAEPAPAGSCLGIVPPARSHPLAGWRARHAVPCPAAGRGPAGTPRRSGLVTPVTRGF